MLVLSRMKNQRIRINDDITLVIVDIRGDKVKVGIEAPKDVSVHRQEVHQAIQRASAKPPEDPGDDDSPPQRPTNDDLVDAGLRDA